MRDLRTWFSEEEEEDYQGMYSVWCVSMRVIVRTSISLS